MLASEKHRLVSWCFLTCLSFIGCGKSSSDTRSLNELDPSKIPAKLQIPDQPPEVVAIIAPPASTSPSNFGSLGLAFNPDGTRLAVSYGWGFLVVFNSGTLDEIATIHAHPQKPISSVLFAPDGKRLIDGSFDFTAKIWELKERQLVDLLTLKGHTDHISELSLTPDGKTLASGSSDKTIRFWDMQNNPPKELGVVQTEDPVYSLSFAPDGQTLACTQDRHIALWKVGTDKQRIAILEGHSDTIWRVTYAGNGRLLASASRDKSVRLWDIDGEKPKERISLKGHDSFEIYGLKFSPDAKHLVSADYTGRVILWDVDNGVERIRWQMPKGLRAVAFAPDNRHFALSCDDDKVYVLRLPQ